MDTDLIISEKIRVPGRGLRTFMLVAPVLAIVGYGLLEMGRWTVLRVTLNSALDETARLVSDQPGTSVDVIRNIFESNIAVIDQRNVTSMRIFRDPDNPTKVTLEALSD